MNLTKRAKSPDVGVRRLGEDHLRSHLLEPGFWPVTGTFRSTRLTKQVESFPVYRLLEPCLVAGLLVTESDQRVHARSPARRHMRVR